MNEKKFRFSKNYVLDVTAKHMIRAVDISLDKTAQRMEQLTPEEGQEVLETISELFKLRKFLKEYRERFTKDETSSW
jgi:hypothetical protein